MEATRHPSSQASYEPGAPRALQDLLAPSLQGAAPGVEIYSTRASFLVAFFGGGLAAVLFSGLNARRLGRLSRDLWVLLAGGLLFLGLMGWLGYLAADVGLAEMRSVRDIQRPAFTLLGVMFFGVMHLRHRRLIRAIELTGREPLGPWKAGLACCGASWILSFIAIAAGAWLRT